MHTPRAQVHRYQSQAIRPEEKKPQLIKPLPKYILTDASTSTPHIPVVQRWRDLQAHQEEINQLNRPRFVRWDRENKYPEPIDRSHYCARPTTSYSLLDSSGASKCRRGS